MPREGEEDDPPSPISPILPSSPPISGMSSQSHYRTVMVEDEEDVDNIGDFEGIGIDSTGSDAHYDLDEYDDDDEDDVSFGYEDASRATGVGDGSNMSLPSAQKRHLTEMESSFHGSSSMLYSSRDTGDADLSIIGGRGSPNISKHGTPRSGSAASNPESGPRQKTLRRVGDMGPPLAPASAYKATSASSSRSSSRQRQQPQHELPRAHSRSQQLRHQLSALSDLHGDDNDIDRSRRSPSLGSAFRTPHMGNTDDGNTDADSSSFNRERQLEDFSSPSVAAQSRSISRAASAQHKTPAHMTGRNSRSGTPVEQQTPIGRQASNSSLHNEKKVSSKPSKRRLRDRRNSVRSSVSSIGSATISDLEDDDNASTVRQGSDLNYGSQDSPTRSEQQQQQYDDNDDMEIMSRPSVSRHASFGSSASAATAGAAADKTLARVAEEEGRRSRATTPVTPKGTTATKPGDRLPTDTTIAAHIRNIQIPASVTRDFKNQQAAGDPTNGLGGSSSPSKQKFPASTSKNMTLKEQSGIIDKLQKENFDLKLKVYYMNDKLEKASEEGVAEMTRENVEFRMKILELGRVIKTLKKRIRDLEKENGQQEIANSLREGSDEEGGMANEEEITFWQERTERLEIELENARQREVQRESEMGKLSEIVRGMTGGGEEMEILRDIMDSEVIRREHAEADNNKLRDEIWQLKSQLALGPNAFSNVGSARSRGTMAQASDTTLVMQLRQENEELRREVSAQTSMLTSRNREKDRLYQEIEDLKLGLIRNGEAERDDYENANGQLRDKISELRLRIQDLEIDLETRLRELDIVTLQRQEFNDLIVKYEEELELLNNDLQQLQAERDDSLKQREDLEVDFDALKAEAEEEIQRLEEELDMRLQDVEKLESEVSNREENFNALQNEMRSLSEIVVRLEDTSEEKMRKIQSLEGDLEKARGTLNENESEFNAFEKQLMEATEKAERLAVQQESAQGEITFLREEQDGDKIKIGELEAAIKVAEEGYKDELDRARKLQDRLVEERKLREDTRDLNRQEYDKLLNEKNQELLNTKESARQLKKTLTRREQEAREWKDRLSELENALREALGDLSGTRSGMLKALQQNLSKDGKAVAANVSSSDGRAFVQSIVNLQLELEHRMEELHNIRNELAEKEATLKGRENLMESMALETRKLTDLLDKERQARRSEKAAAENLQNSNAQSRRAIEKQHTHLSELEKQRTKDSRALIQLESQFKEQIADRNSLLVQLWQKLSAICGSEWAHRNPLVGKTGTPQPAEVVVTTALQAYTKNILLALKTIESAIAGFKTRCKNVERDLWKEYQVVENTLETRTRRLERLEAMVRDGVGEQSSLRTDLAKLRTENRLLKAELNVVRLQATRNIQRSASGTSTPGGPGETSLLPAQPNAGPAGLSRAHSSSVVPSNNSTTALSATSASLGNALAAAAAKNRTLDDVTDESERRWILRLRELEKRLATEREARVLERTGAKLRLDEIRGESEGLKKELERERASSRLAKHDEEEEEEAGDADRLLRPSSKRHKSDRGKSTEREAPNEMSKTTLVKVDRDKENRKDRSRDRREKSRDRRDRDKDRDREHHKNRDRDRDRSRDGRDSKLERSILKDKERERDRDRNSERGSHKSSSTSARSLSSMKRTDSSSSKKGMHMFGGGEDSSSISSSKKDAKEIAAAGRMSPRKDGSALSPRKLFDFISGGKERRGSDAGM